MKKPQRQVTMIPVAQVEALLGRQRFVPGYGEPKVSVSSGVLPELGFAIPLPDDARDIASVHYGNQENESLEFVFSSQLSKDEIEYFYTDQLGKRGYSASDNSMMMNPAAFRVSGESASRPLLLCGGPKAPAWWVAVRTEGGTSAVFVRINLNPEHSPCAQRRRDQDFHRKQVARMPSLAVPVGTEVRNLGSSASGNEINQNALLSGDTTIADIVSSFLSSAAEAKLSVVASETGSAMGYVEWSSGESGDIGIVTVVQYGARVGQFELTSRMRLAPGSPPPQGGGSVSITLG